MTGQIEVRPIRSSAHEAFVTDVSGSFLQTPAWGAVKTGWVPQSLGWYDGEQLVGAGLMLLRPIPLIRRYLAYLPEGPVVKWLERPVADWLDPLASYARTVGAFAIKVGVQVPVRRWDAGTIKAAVADESTARLGDVMPDWTESIATSIVDQLRSAGWTQAQSSGAGFGDLQPRYVFQVPLGGRSLDDVFAGFNQLWRRNIRRADKLGVEVSVGTTEELADFHPVYVETAARDGFTPRGLEYFQRMFAELNNEDAPDRARLFVARHDGVVHASTIMITVGKHAWYAYGASTTAGRDLRPSNAAQWAMISAAHASGCTVYDLRGITDTLDPADPLYGLIGFKLGTGGYAQEYIGEWDYPLRPALARAVNAYLSRR